MSEFGFQSTADEVLEGMDLSGRTVFITGAYSGLGHETARAMGAKGAHLILSGRDQAKLDAAAKSIADETGANVETLVCDLASLGSIRAASDEANRRFEKIDILINNAGVMACPLSRTADGFEMQFGTNHLGHFLLTNRLMPLVEKGSDQRIVNLSSRGHHIDRVHFDDLNYETREYEKWQSYGQSKTANVLFSIGLDERLSGKGIRAFALHPGGIMTNLGRHLSPEDMAALMDRIKANAEAQGKKPDPLKTIPQGAATTCWVATADDLDGKGGLYAEDCHIAEQDDESASGGVRSYAIDRKLADQLWSASEELVGESFAY